jgi:DNA mismatch repair ATPase MutS
VLIATHDLELGIMQQKYPKSIQNLRFESNIQKGMLSFDYQLQIGIAKNKNATFLMRKMGIIPQQNAQE